MTKRKEKPFIIRTNINSGIHCALKTQVLVVVIDNEMSCLGHLKRIWKNQIALI